MINVPYTAEALRHYLATELFDIYDPIESTRGLALQVLSGPLGGVPILNDEVTTYLFRHTKKASDGSFYENLEIFVDDIGNYNKWVLCSVNQHVFSGTILKTPGTEPTFSLPPDRGVFNQTTKRYPGDTYSDIPLPVIPKIDAFNLLDLNSAHPDNNFKILSENGKMLPLHNIKIQSANSTVDSVSGHVYMLIPYAHFLNTETATAGVFDDFFVTIDNEKRSFARLAEYT